MALDSSLIYFFFLIMTFQQKIILKCVGINADGQSCGLRIKNLMCIININFNILTYTFEKIL